jgi:alpha-tubulin suppressor-like RCC1 family protein
MRRFALLIVAAAAFAACVTEPEPPVATTLTVTGPDTIASLGATSALATAIVDQRGQPFTGLTVNLWETSDASVAAVSAQGVVTGMTNGLATITARAGTLSGTKLIVVRQKPSAVNVTGAQPIGSIGSTVALTAVATDAMGNAINGRPFTWTTSAANVATVNATTGVVTGAGNGSATITATLEGTAGSASIAVAQVPHSITINAPTDTMRALTATAVFSATVKDSGGTPIAAPTLRYQSSNAAIVSVDSMSGNATAVANGSVYLRVTSTPRVDSVKLTVRQRVKLSSAQIAIASPLALVGDVVPMAITLRDSLDAPMTTSEAVTFSLGSGGTSDGTFSTVTFDGSGGYAVNFTATAAGTARALAISVSGAAVPAPPTMQVVTVTKVATHSTSNTGSSCAIVSSGDMYCWGSIWVRGHGSATTPTGGDTLATKVVGGHQWATVDIGGHNAICGITTAGKLYCWGDASEGSMGNGTGSGNFWTPVPIAADSTFTSLELGHVGGGCAITAARNAVCWGGNAWGRLGNASDTSTTRHVAVAGGSKFTAVTTSYAASCGVTDGSIAMCWGHWATLGITAPYPDKCSGGATDCARTPVATTGGKTFKPLIAHHGNEVCAVGTDNTTYCWGSRSSTPDELTGAPSLTAIASGDMDFCGLNSSGAVYCWGYNGNGRFGLPENAGSAYNFPTALGGGLLFSQLSMSVKHACGVTTAGSAYCWGWNTYGQLGDRTRSYSQTPVRVRLFVH